jgi:CarD family transcriptional regulator
MMLNINETIVYGMDGVCKVVGKTRKKVKGKASDYYILKPVYSENSTIFIPVNNEKTAAKVHQILSVEEIHALIREMPNEDTLWIQDEAKRKEEYRKILAGSDRMQLARLIRTLYLHERERKSEGKKLHAVDERCMKEAEKMLYEEFAHVLDIDPDQVLPFILSQIDVKEKSVAPH